MKVEIRENAICVVAETPSDNHKMSQIGADPDRARVDVVVTKDTSQPVGEHLFEPLVIAIFRIEDEEE